MASIRANLFHRRATWPKSEKRQLRAIVNIVTAKRVLTPDRSRTKKPGNSSPRIMEPTTRKQNLELIHWLICSICSFFNIVLPAKPRLEALLDYFHSGPLDPLLVLDPLCKQAGQMLQEAKVSKV